MKVQRKDNCPPNLEPTTESRHETDRVPGNNGHRLPCRADQQYLARGDLQGIPLLEGSNEVGSLAKSLLSGVPLPEKAATDALHISIAAVNGIQYLLTWNCKHIANPLFRPGIERVCREMGYEAPVICTPQELLQIDDVT